MSSIAPLAESEDTLSPEFETADERLLVDLCVAGDEAAWGELHRRYHDRMLRSIHMMFGNQSWDPSLADEIAARVWYVVVTNRSRALARFNPQRGRLSTFLATIARSEGLNALDPRSADGNASNWRRDPRDV